MPRLVIQPAARRDLNDILRHVTRESGSRETALRFVQILRDRCRHLASLPGTLGRPRPDLAETVRSFVVRGYIVVFRYDGDTLRVISVTEGHREVAAQLPKHT